MLHRRLIKTLDHTGISYEVIYVDDGSQDGSLALLRSLAHSHGVRVLSLSRSFGHQAALMAGIESARGAAVITMDADLQDPPELIPQLVAKWHSGYQVVVAQRVAREGEPLLRKLAIVLYYRLLRRIADHPASVDVGDYRLLDRRVVDILTALPERRKYIRGLVSWAGFRQATVPHRRPARLSGRSKFTYGKLVTLALNGISASSKWPLHLSAYLGGAMLFVGGVLGGYALADHVGGGNVVSGWVLAIAALSMLSGLQLVGLGLLGIYLGEVLEQVRNRPAYLVAWDSDVEVASPSEPLAVANS